LAPSDLAAERLRAQASATHGWVPARSLDRRSMAVLALGHLCVDLCQGALPALLPFLIAAHGWSYGQASALVLAATVSSSIIQPLFGHLSDGRSLPWLMPGGVAVAAVGISLAGVVGSYAATFAVVVVSGLGVAAYHPEASRFANYVAGAKRATAMSFFSVGGNAGLALGPAIVTPLALAFGLSGTPLVAVLPLAVAVVLVLELGRLKSFRPAVVTAGDGSAAEAVAEPDQWRPFIRLTLAIAARSIVFFGLTTLVPLYFVGELHASEGTANTALTVMLACGAVGTLIGGRMADRFSRRIVLRTSLALLTPLMVVMLAGGVGVAIGALAFIGAATIATFSVTVVMGQEYLPGRLGVASGVTLGLSIGVGGVTAAGLGALADATSLRTALEVLAVVPLPALALALSLPEGRRPERGRAPAQAAEAASLTAG
jgi:MFS transporter, FSR family, fosmidomycin resistance protein